MKHDYSNQLNSLNVLSLTKTALKATLKAEKLIMQFLLMVLLVVFNQAQAQSPISGTVLEETTGDPLPGVTVMLKGTSTGTITDGTGRFALEASPDDILVFSFVGFTRREISVGNQTDFSVTLEEDITELLEIVVVGYGEQKKENLTGAVASIEAKTIVTRPVGQVSTALQGVSPGVTVTQSSGQPGADQGTIRIRGIGTFNDNAPLVLVDGVQYDINDIDPNDIESVSVLKDAAASSIYGVRAANGVILITTRRGEKGAPKISYNNYFGWQRPTKLPDYVGAQKYMELINLRNNNSGGSDFYSQAQINAYNDPNRNVYENPDVNWFEEVLSGSGFQQSHSLGIAGGAENIKYRFSTNYFDQKGLVENMDFDRITVRLNTDINLTDKLKFNADISAKISDRSEPQGQEGSAWYQFGQAAITNPLSPIKNSDGEWVLVRGQHNALRLQEEGGLYEYKENLYMGNFRADYEIIEGLTVSGLASINNSSQYNSQHNKKLWYGTSSYGMNEVYKTSVDFWFTNIQGLLNYKKTFGEHSIQVLGGISRLTRRTDNLVGYRRNIPSTDLEQLNAGEAEGQSATGTAYRYALQSYFGRINYSYKDRYLLEANIRRDGSSRFADGQKWGTFPSFSAGWLISREAFMKDVTFIDELKLRGSWGKLGNDNTLDGSGSLDYYPYQSTIALSSYPFGGSLTQTASLSNYPNQFLTWETTQMTDFGIDLVVLNGKIDATFDYYVKTTDDILLQLPLTNSLGFTEPFQNAGSIRNEGWEFAVNYHGTVGSDFTYTVGGNIADVKNEVTDMRGTDYLATDGNGIVTSYQVGDPIGAYYGYISDGIFQSQAEVDAHASQPGGTIGAGDLIYRDVEEDGVINSEDRVYLGSNIPRYTYGINLGAEYKNFSFSAFLQGVAKVDINTMPILEAPVNSDGNFRGIHEDSWTPENTGAEYPRLVTSDQNYQSSSYWVKSGAYLRLKNVRLNYRLPSTWLERVNISHVSLFVSGQNLLTFTGLEDGIDPEAPNDTRYYPQVKVYTFGVNVNF
ncbi:SusC/RagA family TonB-linked outer membrane protein [Fulvivirga sediminis]|uniref:TonB-dependent receptor n=1 Tax=Fulvivirga sediminis TaxID=2803949 RepID=A0A937JYP6_9BACT|nr:TonB-dependent receptor [Fulvivirga sediminis]MBL3655884.1 TonB-dependent receptor [Fulvivirga sediminis]